MYISLPGYRFVKFASRYSACYNIHYTTLPLGRRRYVAEFRKLRRNHNDQRTEEPFHVNRRNSSLATAADISQRTITYRHSK